VCSRLHDKKKKKKKNIVNEKTSEFRLPNAKPTSEFLFGCKNNHIGKKKNTLSLEFAVALNALRILLIAIEHGGCEIFKNGI
jgi:hypothetical protein